MHPQTICRTITIILGFFAILFSDFSVAEAKPSLRAPAKVTVNEPFKVTVQPAPRDLFWKYDSSKLRLVEQGPGRAVFEALDVGVASIEATSAQTGWSSGTRTIQVLPASGSRQPKKPGTPGETAADPIAESPKMQKIKNLLDNYKKTLAQAGLEGQFTRKDSGAEKQKVKLGDDQARQLGQISEQFLTEMANSGLTMHDMMEFRRVMGEASASSGDHALFPGSGGWDATYLGTERALMMGRAEMVNQVWIETISEAFKRHPEWVGVDKGQNPVIYGRMDIGSWVKMDLGGLAFKADIDFSSLATCLAANREVKAIFAEILQKHLQTKPGLDLPKIIDSVITPHEAAGGEVFIGEWGQAFAEVDMLKRSSWTLLIPEMKDGKPVFDDQGRIKLKTKVMSGQALFWERAFRTGEEYKPPKIDITVEPMLSLEMLRHMTADIVKSSAFGRGDKIVKMLKYVERSYFFNKKATSGTGWDPYQMNDPTLANLCNELFKERKEGDKKFTWAKDPEKVVALVEQLNGGPITEGNVNELVQNIAEKCRKAIVRNSEMGLAARLRIIADIEDETKRREALDKLWDQMDREMAEFKKHDVEVPGEISRLLMLAKAFQMGLVGPELIKTVDELRKIYIDVLGLGQEVCDRLLITDAWNKVRDYCKKKLKWKDQKVEKFVKEAKAKYPDAVKFYRSFQRFNDQLSKAADGSKLLSLSDWADSGLSVYEAFMSGTDENDCYRKAAWQMGQIFVQIRIPESAIPIAVLNSLSEGSPAPLAMAVTFYYFPWVGQYYTLGVNLKRLDVGMRDKEFYNSLGQMLNVTDFDQSGKITRFSLKDATGKYARDEADVSPPGDREVIVKIFEAPDSPFAIAPNFRYWRTLIPDASDYYSYTTKLQNLRRFFPNSEEIRFWTIMLENTKGKKQEGESAASQALPADQYEAKRQETLAVMETQLKAAVWVAMADALESAAKSSKQIQEDEWKKKIAELEREFSLSDLDLGKDKGLQGQINFEILQATGKATQWTEGDNIYAVGLIYEKYIKAYTDLKEMRSKIFQIWQDFRIDTGKAQSRPMKLLLDGPAKLGAPWLNGNLEHDLAAGQKALAAHQARAGKIKSDLAEALGRPVDGSKDRTHLQILGQYGFEWEHLRDDAPEAGESIGIAAVRSAVIPKAMDARYKAYMRYLALLKAVATLGIDGPDTLEAGKTGAFKATTAGKAKIPAEIRLFWTDPAKIGAGPAISYTPKQPGTKKLAVAAMTRWEGRDITMAEAVKVIQVAGGDAAILLSDPQPALNQQVSATLVLKAWQPPKGTQIRWRASGGVKIVQSKGPTATLVAQGEGQVTADLVLQGKVIKELSAGLFPRAPGGSQEAGGSQEQETGTQETAKTGQDQETGGTNLTGGPEGGKGDATGSKDVFGAGKEQATGATLTTKTGQEEGEAKFPIKIKAPAEVGSTEIFKAAVEVPAEFARRNLEYMWTISGYGHLLNPVNSFYTKGPEAVIQPNYDWMVQKDLSTLEISVAVDELRGYRSNAGKGKIIVKVRPEGFSAKAPKSWTGKADRYGVNLNYGKRETAPNGIIIGMYSGQLIVSPGGASRVYASDREEVAPAQMPPGAQRFALGDFQGYLVEKPPTGNSGGVGSLSGEFSKGKITFTVSGRVSLGLGAVANQEQIQAGKQRLQSLYQEMLEAVKSVRLGSGSGMTWTGATDAASSTGEKTKDTTTDKTAETPKPLTVKLNAAKTQLLPGENVSVEAVVENTDPKDQPLTYTWTGEHTGQGAKVEFVAAKPGRYTLKVAVKSPKGATGTASLDLDVGALKAEIVKVSPAGNEIPVGGSATFKVNFNGVPGRSYIYQWQPHPEAAWDKQESPKTQATATFLRPESVLVWVKVLEKKGAALTAVAESPQLKINVVKPQVKVTFSPKAPLIGQEVRARLEITPVPPDLSVRWLPLPGNAQLLKENQSGRMITFTIKDDKPVPVKVLALVGSKGDSLGEASGTVQAKKFTVTATVAGPLGPEPVKWDPVKKGLVPDPKAIAIHQNVRVKAAITPDPFKGPVRWRWSVNPDSHIVSGHDSAEVMVNRSQTGSCEVTVTAEDSQGSNLGTAKTSFTVSVNQGVVAKEMREAAQEKAAEGKLDEAISIMEQAVRLDARTPNTNFLKKLRADKDTILKQLEKTRNLISQGKFTEAEKELAAAKSLNNKFPPVLEAENLLAQAKAGLQQQVAAKLAQAKNLAGQGRLDEAIKLAQEAAKLDPQNPEAPKLAATWQALKEKVAKLKAEGKNLESQSKLAEAIGKYQESLKYLPDPKLAEHVKALQAKLEKDKRNRETAKHLRDEGTTLQGQGKLAEAIAKYTESLKYYPDPNLESHIRTLQTKLDQDKQKQVTQDKANQEKEKQAAIDKEKAKQLRNEGAAFQQQGKLAEAIAKYGESLKYYPDPNLESHIRTLQTKLDQDKQKQVTQDKANQEKEKQAAINKEKAKQLRNEGAAFQQQGKLAEAIAKYKESLKYFSDQNMERIIAQLQANLAKQQHEVQGKSNTQSATAQSYSGTFTYRYAGDPPDRSFNGTIDFSLQNSIISGNMKSGGRSWSFKGGYDPKTGIINVPLNGTYEIKRQPEKQGMGRLGSALANAILAGTWTVSGNLNGAIKANMASGRIEATHTKVAASQKPTFMQGTWQALRK
jgi:tetratricopeptide (TPR) repeat protein